MRSSMAQRIRLSEVGVMRGSVIALDGVDLEFEPGTVTAVLGANGSGKSTLLAVLAGLLVPSSGEVGTLPAGGVALVTQSTPRHDSLPITVRETVTMGRWASRGRLGRIRSEDRHLVREWLDRLGLAELADRQLGELSGGQRQRALVARGLCQQADLTLVDEPTAAADQASTAVIHQVLREVADDGRTVVLASHDPSAREIADSTVVLAEGRIVARG